jgi:hypothetical protein
VQPSFPFANTELFTLRGLQIAMWVGLRFGALNPDL